MTAIRTTPAAMRASATTGARSTADPTIPTRESGHPLQHEFTRAIPDQPVHDLPHASAQHVREHLLGYTMWDYESDAPFMWPQTQQLPERRRSAARPRSQSRRRGRRAASGATPISSHRCPSSIPSCTTRSSPTITATAGISARCSSATAKAICSINGSAIVADDDPAKFKKAVHLCTRFISTWACTASIATSRRTRTATATSTARSPPRSRSTARIATARPTRYPRLRTSGPAAPPGGTDLATMRTTDGRKRFEWREGKLYQRSALDPKLEWAISLVKDTVNPKHPRYNEKAARAKLMARGSSDGYAQHWGPGVPPADRAHRDDKMTCYTCHISWTTSCDGCHLPIEANWKTERHHYEGGVTRNYATYNPQVARDDIFQLGVSGPVKGSKVAPIRSSSALVLVFDQRQRERIYVQQPPIIGERLLEPGVRTALPAYRAHARRPRPAPIATSPPITTTTRSWRSCCCREPTSSTSSGSTPRWARERHVAGGPGDRVGRAAGGDRQLSAALRLSGLVRRAPASAGAVCTELHDHGTGGPATCIQLRGEYLYVAEGAGGMRVYDVAGIANKGISQRIVSAPVIGARPGHPHRCEERDLRRAAHQPAGRTRQEPGRAHAPGQSGAADARDLQLRGDQRCAGGPDPGRREHAAGRRSAQQLPAPRAHVRTGAACSKAHATSRSAATTRTLRPTPASSS